MKKLTDQQRAAFIDAYVAGASNAEACAVAGVGIGSGQKIRREAGIPLNPRTQKREKHPRYLGEEASYNTGHYRVSAWRGKPKYCEVCGLDDPNRRYEWANLTKNYGDIWDYKRMCVPCHRRHDFVPSQVCRNGHDRTPETTYVSPSGVRRCATCDEAREGRRRVKTTQGGTAA